MDRWEFAGWGRARIIRDMGNQPVKLTELGVRKSQAHKLGQWQATAICGNDITSSCLYVSALSIMAAGAYAPIALLLVAAVLYLFRKIYAEVGSALPLNGGTYTLLLNTTNKKMAAGAACFTLLSYIATAVISAGEAMHYLHQLIPSLPVMLATIVLLGIFALLSILGMSESANVALGIFVIHMVTLALLVVGGVIYIVQDPSILQANWSLPPPSGQGVLKTLFLGFSAAMLGISGFESSANFIEEQKGGVFSKTLRNMWIAVSFFNPVICFLALGILPLAEVSSHQTSLLATMGSRSAGSWLMFLISIDAVLVLSGAVLTSYVGVIGLTRRMSLDRCLPPIFLRENDWRKTNHWIIMTFFVLCCGILLSTHGHVSILAGVYTLSFLAVMALFSVGNMLLKLKRARLPRAERASWPAVVIALVAVLIGIAGNLNQKNVEVFNLFFSGMVAIIGLMFLRIHILKFALNLSRNISMKIQSINRAISRFSISKIKDINSRSIIYFTRGDEIPELNRAALYVLENEQTSNLIVVHVFEKEEEIPPELAKQLETVDHLYPELRIDFLAVKGEFGPELIERLSRQLNVPKNYMFIGTPGDHFSHRIASLGGVRLIMG